VVKNHAEITSRFFQEILLIEVEIFEGNPIFVFNFFLWRMRQKIQLEKPEKVLFENLWNL
jgi:hypothetical protein